MEWFMEILINPNSPEDLYELAFLTYIKKKGCKSRPRSKNNTYKKEVTKMSLLMQKYGSSFSREYRMDPYNFHRLHGILKNKLNDMFGSTNRNTTSEFYIPTDIRLSIALRFLLEVILMTYPLFIMCLEEVFMIVFGELWTALMDVKHYHSHFPLWMNNIRYVKDIRKEVG